MEDRIRLAAQRAVQAATYYWEALAADLDGRLDLLLWPDALVLSASPTASRCANLRAFHRVSPAQCLLMAVLFPGWVLSDASFGLRYIQQDRLGWLDQSAEGGRPIWALRVVLDEGAWKIDPFTQVGGWIEVGHFAIASAGSVEPD